MDVSSLFLNQVAEMFPGGICKLLEIQCWAADGNVPNFDDKTLLLSLPTHIRPTRPIERDLATAFLKILFAESIADTEEEINKLQTATPLEILNQNIYSGTPEFPSAEECTYKQRTKIRKIKIKTKLR